MNSTLEKTAVAECITHAELLAHWQGHRGLTRRVIEAFPEKDFFEFSIGGMRPFAGMVNELLAIAGPGIRQMATGQTAALNEELENTNTKATVLALWDQTTDEINTYWPQIPPERFHDQILSFGQYPGTISSSVFYFIDNEIHHRGQGYVYLRALGIEPPQFWNR